MCNVQLCIAPCVIRVLQCAVMICPYFASIFCICLFWWINCTKIFPFVTIVCCTLRNQSAIICAYFAFLFFGGDVTPKICTFVTILYCTLRNQSAAVCSYDMRICTGPLWGQSGKKDIRRIPFLGRNRVHLF